MFFEELQADTDFLILNKVSFGVTHTRPTLKRHGRVPDLKGGNLRLDYRGKKAVLLTLFKYAQLRRFPHITGSEDSTSDWNEGQSSSYGVQFRVEDYPGELVLLGQNESCEK